MMWRKNHAWLGTFCLASLILAGCTGLQSFTTSAKPGETIALAAGWQPQVTRNNLTVVITPESGPVITYSPGDPRIRTVFQSYIDPLAKILVSDKSGEIYPNAGMPNYPNDENAAIAFGQLGPGNAGSVRYATGGVNDWFDTFVLLDLPATLSSGIATVDLFSGGTPIGNSVTIEVLPGTPALRNRFLMGGAWDSLPGWIRSIERAPHFSIQFTGPTGVIPHSIQVDFARTLAASGNPWVTHGRGDISNLSWVDNGTLLKVMQTPVTGKTTNLLSDFNFYVTGAITALTVNTVKAYDVNGNPLPGFSASLQYINN